MKTSKFYLNKNFDSDQKSKISDNIKVIQISPASVSVYMKGQKTLKQMILDDWYSLTAQQLKKYYPKMEVECWTPEKAFKKRREFVNNGVRYRQFPTTFSPMYGLDLSIDMLKAMKEEIRKAKESDTKIIFQLHEYHNLHGLVIASLFKGQRIIAQHHGGSWPLKHLKQNKRYRFFFPAFFIAQIWENIVLRNIPVFFALSQEEINYLKKKAPNSKIRFQTMGIDDFYFGYTKKEEARKKLKWPPDKRILLFLGRLIDVKGLTYLIDAMEELPNCELKVIGWGEEEKFKNYAKSKKLNNVEFLGPIFGEKKCLYLSAADALVLPSSKEGAPVTVMEALARNLPVVVTDIGGVKLMIENRREGMIIKQKSSNEIVKAVGEILKWKKKNVKKYAEKYRWRGIINSTVKDYLGK